MREGLFILCATQVGQTLQEHSKMAGNLTDLLEPSAEDVPALKRWLTQRDKCLTAISKMK